MRSALRNCAPPGQEWTKRWLAVDFSTVTPAIQPLKQHQQAKFGRLDVQSLLHAPVYGGDLLLDPSGEPIGHAEFAACCTTSLRLRDVLDIQWVGEHKLCFRSLSHEFPLTDKAARCFRKLCNELVFNSPGLLEVPAQPEDMVLRPASLDIWRLKCDGTSFVLDWNPVDDVHVPLGEVTSTKDANRLARKHPHDAEVRFDRHTWLDPQAGIWSTTREPSAHRVNALLLTSAAIKARKKNESRQRRWEVQDKAIAKGLDQLTWKELAALPSLSTRSAPS